MNWGGTVRDIDLKTLRLFVAVCDHSNIGRAAAEAHIEPSAISKRIAQMETDLGVTLLTRTRRGVLPTPAGLAVLENARSVLFTMERIAADAASFGGGLKGRVSLCASASAIAESLLDDISDFLSIPAYGDIRVEVEERLSVDLVRRIREGSASVGVCWDNVSLDGLQAVPYREDSLALAVHPAHPLAGRRSLSFHESLDYEQVGLPPATAVHTLLARAAASEGKTVTYRAVVSSFDAALRVVAANLGISVIPAEVGEIYQTSRRIRTIALTDAWAQRRFVICYRDFNALPPAAQRMVEHLAARAAV